QVLCVAVAGHGVLTLAPVGWGGERRGEAREIPDPCRWVHSRAWRRRAGRGGSARGRNRPLAPRGWRRTSPSRWPGALARGAERLAFRDRTCPAVAAGPRRPSAG